MLTRIIIAVVLALVCTSTLAATVLHLSDHDLTRRATDIVEGAVEDSVARLGSDGEMRRYTRIRAKHWWKDGGTRPEIITVRQLCGGEACTPIPGDARFRKNEPVLVFLRAENTRPGGDYFVVGMAQGKFSIQDRHGRKFLTRDAGSLNLVYKSGPKDREFSPTRYFPRNYAEFVAALRTALNSAHAPGVQP